MPVLENYRHELFAQGIAKGKSQRDAYNTAGYDCATDDTTDANASRLLSDARVSARVQELLSLGAKRAGITLERIAVEYAKIGFAETRRAVKWSNQLRTRNIDDAVDSVIANGRGDAPVIVEDETIEVLESAVLLVPSDELDEDTAAAISEVSQTKDGIKIKFHDKKGALDSLTRMMGGFVEKVEHSGPGGGPIRTSQTDLKNLSDEELATMMALLDKAEQTAP